MMRNALPTEQSGNRAEIQQAIRDAQVAARNAAADARTAAQDARTAAQDSRTSAQDSRTSAQDSRTAPSADAPRPAQAPGTIIIPSDGGGDPVSISVDGKGIHVSQNGSETVIPLHDIVPRGAVQMTWAVFGSLAFMVVGYPLARAFARWLDRRGSASRLSSEVEQRLAAMDRNIDTVAVELERVSEGQRFTAKLLEQRPLEHAQRIDR
ncbi:MAG: hypothetical protein IPP90_00765 [Gemmatimonadaceae bacterium]|nr:hypothetical protein [Gemmatimonadaceae bacterium]